MTIHDTLIHHTSIKHIAIENHIKDGSRVGHWMATGLKLKTAWHATMVVASKQGRSNSRRSVLMIKAEIRAGRQRLVGISTK